MLDHAAWMDAQRDSTIANMSFRSAPAPPPAFRFLPTFMFTSPESVGTRTVVPSAACEVEGVEEQRGMGGDRGRKGGH